MTKNELIYMKTVADYKNISKAAKKLYISQPSLTNAIKKIETKLGTKLFLRTNKGLILTEAGEKYYSVAINILNMYADLELELSDINNMKKGRLSIGITNHVANKVLPLVLPKFERLAPNIDVSFEELNAEMLEEALLSGDIQFALMHRTNLTNSNTQKNIKFIDILTSKFLLATKKGHPLSRFAINNTNYRFPYMDIKRFAKEPFILSLPGQRSREVINNVFINSGFSPYIKYTSKSHLTLCKLVCCGLGVSLLPEIYLDLFTQNNYEPDFYYIDPSLNGFWTLSVAINKNAYLSKAAKLLIRLMGEHYSVENLETSLK